MSSAEPISSELDGEALLRVLRLVERLEDAWKRGEPVPLEHLLPEVSPAERAESLRQAVGVELEYRRRRGESPALEEYLRRFPEDSGVIRSALEEPTRPHVAASTALMSTLAEHPVRPASPTFPDVPGYEVLDELGRGGMGVVYRARHLQLKRVVALKVIRDGRRAGPGELARFRTEAEALARLKHAHIVDIYDIGETDGLPFVALEFLEGGNLAGRLARTPQPVREAARMAATLARAMHAAHQAGVVHRDLKPLNVLLDRDGVLKIADFGLAKLLDADDVGSWSGQVMGTPNYMAPEQARGQRRLIGPATDVYALGAILYEMLTGRPPFQGPTHLETLALVRDEEPVPPSRLQPKVPRDLETICLKCLAKGPDKRYPTAQDLADDLERYLNGEPVRARRTPPWARAAKWARRHPMAATLAALALVALVTAAAAGVRHKQLVIARQLQEDRRVAVLRGEADEALFEGQGFLSRGQWTEAREVLTNLRTRLRDEPRLADRSDRAAGLLAQADRGRADQEEGERDRRRYVRFLQARRDALFHDTQFTGLDLPGNREATRRSARDALAVFAAPDPGGAWALGVLPDSLTDTERADITAGCYELLLVLAEATDRPDEGLRLLDRAAALHPPTRAYHLRRAACLDRLGDATAAGQARREAGRTEPSSAFDHFLTGKELYKRRDWPAALRQFDAALRRQPGHFWAECLSAVCCFQMQRFLEARAALNACLQAEPDFAWLYILRGLASGQVAVLARGVADQVPARGDALRAEVEAQFNAAEADYQEALRLLGQSPNDELRYVLLHNRGLMRLQRRELGRAAEDLREAIRLDGRHYQAFAALALVCQAQGQPDQALEQYTCALERRPGWAPLYRARADVTLGLKDPDEGRRARALDDLEQALRYTPPGDSVRARDQSNRARLLRRGGKGAEALAACDAALAVRPDDADAHRLRLGLLLELKRFDDLAGSCDALLARGRSWPELYELRGLARAARRDYAGAIEDATQALVLRPDQAPLLARRGRLYLLTDAPRLALRDFDRALALAPSDGDALTGRGAARVRLGQHRQAVADAEAALRLGPPMAIAFYNAARIYALAAAAASSEVGRTGHDAVYLTGRYRDRAVALVHEALNRLPPDRRAAFLRDPVQTDPALRPLLRRLAAAPVPGERATKVRDEFDTAPAREHR